MSFLDQSQHSLSKPMESRNTFDTQLKIALLLEEEIMSVIKNILQEITCFFFCLSLSLSINTSLS